MKKELIIFDLDGTLADSAPTLANALNKALKSVNMEPFDQESIRNWIGRGASVLVKRAIAGKKEYQEKDIDENLFKKLLERFLCEYERILTEGTTLFEGVEEGLQRLKEMGLSMAVATNKPVNFVAPVLNSLKIDHYFFHVVGAEESLRKKPQPDMLLKIIKLSGISPEKSLMVGDTLSDMEAAARAKVDFVAVSYGYEKPQTEAKIDSIVEIAEILK